MQKLDWTSNPPNVALLLVSLQVYDTVNHEINRLVIYMSPYFLHPSVSLQVVSCVLSKLSCPVSLGRPS